MHVDALIINVRLQLHDLGVDYGLRVDRFDRHFGLTCSAERQKIEHQRVHSTPFRDEPICYRAQPSRSEIPDRLLYALPSVRFRVTR